jgi:hypothetical protein
MAVRLLSWRRRTLGAHTLLSLLLHFLGLRSASSVRRRRLPRLLRSGTHAKPVALVADRDGLCGRRRAALRHPAAPRGVAHEAPISKRAGFAKTESGIGFGRNAKSETDPSDRLETLPTNSRTRFEIGEPGPINVMSDGHAARRRWMLLTGFGAI